MVTCGFKFSRPPRHSMSQGTKALIFFIRILSAHFVYRVWLRKIIIHKAWWEFCQFTQAFMHDNWFKSHEVRQQKHSNFCLLCSWITSFIGNSKFGSSVCAHYASVSSVKTVFWTHFSELIGFTPQKSNHTWWFWTAIFKFLSCSKDLFFFFFFLLKIMTSLGYVCEP